MVRYYNSKWSNNPEVRDYISKISSSNSYKNVRKIYECVTKQYPDLSLTTFYRIYNSLGETSRAATPNLLQLLLSSSTLFTPSGPIPLTSVTPILNNPYLSAEAILPNFQRTSFFLCPESTILTKPLLCKTYNESVNLSYNHLIIIGFEPPNTKFTSIPFTFLTATPYLFTGISYFYKPEPSSPFHFSISIENLDLPKCVEILLSLPTKLEIDTKTQLNKSLSDYLCKPIDSILNDFTIESIRLSCDIIDAFNYDIPFFAKCLASSQFYLPYFFEELLKFVEDDSIKVLNIVESCFCSVFSSYPNFLKTWYSNKSKKETTIIHGIKMPGDKGIAIFDIPVDFF